MAAPTDTLSVAAVGVAYSDKGHDVDELDVFGYQTLGMDDDGQTTSGDHDVPMNSVGAEAVRVEDTNNYATINFGGWVLHATYTLHRRQGVIWCWKCGF